MARYLLIDVGAGTMDVLYWDDGAPLHFKAVAESPVRHLARRVAELPGDLLVTGSEMGGGPVSQALAERARDHRVVMSPSAAATINHDLDQVRLRGIEVLDADPQDPQEERPELTHLRLADVDVGRLNQLLSAFGVSSELDVVGCCLQDHGVPPAGVTHLEHRHRTWTRRLEADPRPHQMLWAAGEVPPTFNRLCSAADDAALLVPREIYVMDSGAAALVGARLDPRCQAADRALVLDVATSHTLGATFEGDKLCGLFEYHTRDLTPERLDELIADLSEGRLDHDEVLAEGGHGAFTRRALGLDRLELILATGPKRHLVSGSRHPITLGAPLGDNMMTGTAGLLSAIRSRRGDGPIIP